MSAFQKVRTILLAPFLKWSPVLCIVLMTGLAPSPAGAFDLLIGTGENGTFSHFAGRILERVISRQAQGIDCTVVPGPGDMHNLTNLKQGSLDLALIDSRMLYDAISQRGNFEFLDIRYDNLKAVVPLYDVPLTLVARGDAGITSIDELKGKRINAGLRRTPRHLATAEIMAAKQWKKSDFSLFGEISSSLSQDTMAFCHGTVQAMVHIGVHPDPSIRQLLQRCNAELLAIDDSTIKRLVETNPAISMTSVAGDTYEGRPDRLNTLSTQTLLVASEDLDEQTVYQILEALFSNAQRLEQAHPALVLKPVAQSEAEIAGAALHAGAALYFSRN